MENASSKFVMKMKSESRASFSLNRHLHYESQGREFFSILAGPGRVWDPDASQDSNDWTAKGVHTKCSTSKMRISPFTQEMALRHSSKKHHFSLTKNLVFSEVVCWGEKLQILYSLGCASCDGTNWVSWEGTCSWLSFSWLQWVLIRSE